MNLKQKNKRINIIGILSAFLLIKVIGLFPFRAWTCWCLELSLSGGGLLQMHLTGNCHKLT